MNTSIPLTLLAILVPTAILAISFILSTNPTLNTADREKASPFECGFDPKSNARLPFSTRYFLLAVLFLVFDIEIILLMPLPAASLLQPYSLTLFASFMFLIILILGLLHEWHEGSLDWT